MQTAEKLYEVTHLAYQNMLSYLGGGAKKSPVIDGPMFQYYGRQIDYSTKNDWSGNLYPHDYVYFPRKDVKLLDNKTFYFLLNNESTYAIVFDGSEILKSSVNERDGILCHSIPMSVCRIVEIGN